MAEAPLHVVVASLEDAEKRINEFEVETVTSFTVFRRNKGFREVFSDLGKHRVKWEDVSRGEGPKIQYSGTPFIILGWDVRECQFGPDRNVTKKLKYQLEKTVEGKKDHSYIQKGRTLVQNTKKQDCPARIHLKRICVFPEYKINGPDSIWKRKDQSRRLKTDLENKKDPVTWEEEIHILFPSLDDHRNHVTGQLAGICQPIDKVIKKKIQCLMDEGVTKVAEMKRHIKSFSKKDLGNTSTQNRRFYPLDKDIRNVMDSYKNQTRFSKDDKENLELLLEEYKSVNDKDSFYLDISETEDFLFVGQTEWQKRLLNMYGQEICLLDATYKTTKYDLPAFFVCVNTNVGYTIVGCFITANETKNSIMRGLQYFKDWNVNWHPKYFMTDFDTSEISAIEETFEDCHVYLCDFHREQAWDRWLKSHVNGCAEYKDEILSMFREIAKSTTENQFEQNLDNLRSSKIWKNKLKLQQWFERIWLANYERWVSLFRRSLFNVRVSTTNGLERQHLKLKQEYLSHTSDKSLSNLVNVLFSQVFPESYTRYIQYNARSLDSCKAYITSIPSFLKNRPRMLVEHCVKRMPPQVLVIPGENIRERSSGNFQVKSVDSGSVYDINLETPCPSCTCYDWQKYHLPCKHMLAVFHNYPSWDWDFLPAEYRDAPHFNLDFEILESIPNFESKIKQSCPVETSPEIPVHVSPDERPNSCTDAEERESRLTDAPSNTKDWLQCRELVKQIQGSIMNVCGLNISNIVQQLKQVANVLKEIEPKDDDLPVIMTPKRKRIRNMDDVSHKRRKVSNLPRPKKIKSRKQKAKTTNISLKDVCTPSETDVHMSEEYQDLTTMAKDEIQLQKEVNKIWDQAERTGYVTARCGDTNLTDEDIISLKGNNWLTDQVIDACLGAIAEAETDKGNKVYKMVTSTMTSILDGHCLQKMHLRDVQLHGYQVIIGAYFQEMGHWDLVVIEPMTRTIFFYNPLGETLPQKMHIQENWSHFFNRRISLGLEVGKSGEKWTLKTVPHTKQLDGHNCGVYIILFCERYFTKENISNITSEELRNTRVRLANKLLMYQVYIKDKCPACGFQMKQRQNKITCRQCDRKFHKLPHCVGESLQGDGFEHFTCRQCLACVRETVSEDSVTMKVPQAKNVNQMHSTDIQENRKTFDILQIFKDAVFKSDFSEKDCEDLMDAMQHCGWNSITRAAEEVGAKIPALPNNVQTKFHGYKCLGDFGDGYISLLPASIRKNDMCPLDTGCSPSESLFASISILLWGNVYKRQFLKLAVVCSEIRHCPDKKNLIWKAINSTSTKDTEDMWKMHLKNLASITQHNIIVYTNSGSEIYSSEERQVFSHHFPLLLITLKGASSMSYLPLVESFFVGRGRRFYEKCGATAFGVCQGDFGEKISCTLCGQNYHRHCIEIDDEPAYCGCHIQMPFKLKDLSFYQSDKDVHKVLKKIDIQELIRSIESGEKLSFRMEITKGKHSRRKQWLIEKNKSIMALSEKMIDFLTSKVKKTAHCCGRYVNYALDIYIPEILIKVIQNQETVNRFQAELIMDELPISVPDVQ